MIFNSRIVNQCNCHLLDNKGMKRYFPVVLVVVFLLSCHIQAQARGKQAPIYTPKQAEKIIGKRAQGVIDALRDRQMNRLSQYVDSRRGLRFSPYARATKNDRRFSKSRVRRLGRSQYRYRWGRYDGSGEPIRLAWRDYFLKFVYSRDFARMEQVRYNRIKQRGNTANNLHKFYPGSIVVEYYSPDLQDTAGLDWKSLYLVFQPRGKTWYLVGIAHDQWTI